MSLDRISGAWSAFYDHLQLNSELEGRILRSLSGGDAAPLPVSLSVHTRQLAFATPFEVTDFFRERRDYIESMATLDLVMSLEHLMRNDLMERRLGLKSRVSTVGAGILNTPPPPGQTEPAARRLLSHWRSAVGAIDATIDVVEQAMQYRNWLVHGASGLPPYAVNPFVLDDPVKHVVWLISKEL